MGLVIIWTGPAADNTVGEPGCTPSSFTFGIRTVLIQQCEQGPRLMKSNIPFQHKVNLLIFKSVV